MISCKEWPLQAESMASIPSSLSAPRKCLGLTLSSQILKTGKFVDEEVIDLRDADITGNPQRVPCKECGKITSSTYGMCKKHVGKYQNMEYYYWQKLAKIQDTSQQPILENSSKFSRTS
uniref:Uncharacterized protein n=1 Tax=Rhizophagus irregularis (strain DAOM 181602 / DAOM 197198 / MUCL 43194) TaxID=747089 RepID=U9T1R6_RHIID